MVTEVRSRKTKGIGPKLGIRTGLCSRVGPSLCIIFALATLHPVEAQSLDIINNLVTFERLESTFKTTSDTSGCPSDFAGKFSFEAKITNHTSDNSLSDLVVEATELTNGNLLQNADGEPAGVSTRLTVPA